MRRAPADALRALAEMPVAGSPPRLSTHPDRFLAVLRPPSSSALTSNPHSACCPAGAQLPATSCLGAFWTSVSRACLEPRYCRRPKTCTTADSRTAANAGSRIETRVTSRPPRRSVRAALPHTARTLGRRVDQPLPRQRDEFERRKDGLRLSAASVVNRTSFGLISSCSLATRSCPVRDPG